jgi:hypothetical protein
MFSFVFLQHSLIRVNLERQTRSTQSQVVREFRDAAQLGSRANFSKQASALWVMKQRLQRPETLAAYPEEIREVASQEPRLARYSVASPVVSIVTRSRSGRGPVADEHNVCLVICESRCNRQLE